MRKYLLPETGNFYKANLHTHSTVSDGMLTPEQVKEQYKARGYSVVAYTDHDVLIPHHELTDESFIALSGFEANFNRVAKPGVTYPTPKTCHVCFVARSPEIVNQPCWNPAYALTGNAPEYAKDVRYDENEPFFVREHSPESINEMIKKGREQGFFVTYNHPTWSFENYEDYSKYEGVHALEIMNTEALRGGYPAYVPTIYDDMLRCGKKIFAVAADDMHKTAAIGGGYVMIKAPELTYTAITDALFAGNFYASSGPEIYELYVEDGMVHIKCSEAVAITMNSAARGGGGVFAEEGKALTEACFPFRERQTYLRFSVRDKQGNFADTRAYFIEDFI